MHELQCVEVRVVTDVCKLRSRCTCTHTGPWIQLLPDDAVPDLYEILQLVFLYKASFSYVWIQHWA